VCAARFPAATRHLPDGLYVGSRDVDACMLPSRSPDGLSLLVASEDGYCTLLTFVEAELGTPLEGLYDTRMLSHVCDGQLTLSAAWLSAAWLFSCSHVLIRGQNNAVCLVCVQIKICCEPD
jgi:hypothetical protein